MLDLKIIKGDKKGAIHSAPDSIRYLAILTLTGLVRACWINISATEDDTCKTAGLTDNSDWCPSSTTSSSDASPVLNIWCTSLILLVRIEWKISECIGRVCKTLRTNFGLLCSDKTHERYNIRVRSHWGNAYSMSTILFDLERQPPWSQTSLYW